MRIAASSRATAISQARREWGASGAVDPYLIAKGYRAAGRLPSAKTFTAREISNPREGSVKRYSGYRVVFLNGRYRPVKQWSHTEGLLFTAAEAKRIAKKRNATLSKRTNPRKVRGRSTTLRNMAFVTIRNLPNGVVKISGRKMAGFHHGKGQE